MPWAGSSSLTPSLPQFTFQIPWNQRQCSTLKRTKCFDVYTHLFPPMLATTLLKPKLYKDTAPSCHRDSSSECKNRIPRNISYQANSSEASFPLVTSLLFPTRSYIIPTSYYIAWVFLMDTHPLQLTYSFKSHLWHQIHCLISFPILRTHLPSHLKCKAKAQPSRDPTASFLNTGDSVSCPSQASHWAFIFILSTHIPPVESTRWFILQPCLRDTAGYSYGPDTGNAYKPASF